MKDLTKLLREQAERVYNHRHLYNSFAVKYDSEVAKDYVTQKAELAWLCSPENILDILNEKEKRIKTSS